MNSFFARHTKPCKEYPLRNLGDRWRPRDKKLHLVCRITGYIAPQVKFIEKQAILITVKKFLTELFSIVDKNSQ